MTQCRQFVQKGENSMEQISPIWISHVRFFADIGQIFFFIITIVVSFYTVKFRKEIFRTELQKHQFRELVEIRRQLHELSVDLAYLPSIRSDMEVMKWNIEELRIEAYDDWSQLKRYQSNSLSLFYKFQSSGNYLFPKWIDKTKVQEIFDEMMKFAPFTLYSTTNREKTEIQEYSEIIFSLISYLDRKLAAL